MTERWFPPPALIKALKTYYPACGTGAFLANPPFAIAPMTTTTPHTLHTSPQGLTITARPGPSGQWLVTFMKRGRTTKQLDRCASWNGSWDETRWSPVGSRLVPPAVLLDVEQWLEAHQ